MIEPSGPIGHRFDAYKIIAGRQVGTIGGTSAVGPLWAEIIAGLDTKRTAPLGQLHARLHANHAALRDVISGDNKVGAIGSKAYRRYDTCAGLG